MDLTLQSPRPRLERLLGVLGVRVKVEPEALAPVVGPEGPVKVTSAFAFHQVRQILRALGRSAEDLSPRCQEGRAWQVVLQTIEQAPLLDGQGEPDAQLEVLGGLEGALDVHQALEVRLVRHRVALMQADLQAARRTWDAFSTVMLHHVVTEDALVSSRYEAARPEEGWPRGADPAIVANEHGKIRAKLAEFTEALSRIAAEPLEAPERAARCLELLDRQKVFADLLEHHDMRERAFVYPRLEATLSAPEKEEIVLGLLDEAAWAPDGSAI